MKSIREIQDARIKIRDLCANPGLSSTQKAVIIGMLNAVCWVLDIPGGSSTITKLLKGQELQIGKTAAEANDEILTPEVLSAIRLCKEYFEAVAGSKTITPSKLVEINERAILSIDRAIASCPWLQE